MQRKLTAILSADVVGYSGMMEADEAGTLERLKANRSACMNPSFRAGNDMAKDWMNRALLVDPDNMDMRYNFGCALATYLNEPEAALDVLEPIFTKASAAFVNYAKIDPDLDCVRATPRFIAMIAASDARLAAEEKK
jgi:hypothetical protein